MRSNLNKGLASILIDFSAWTSIHGIPHIGLSNALWLRICWTIVFLASLGMYIYQQVNITLNYFSYPVDVDTELKYGERVFPSVTFCHLNPWNISAAETGPLSDLIKAYRDGTNAASFGFTSNTYDKVKRAEKWAQFYHEDMVAADKLLAASYDYNDLFITCSYDTINCNETQFQSFYDPFFGRCHTFNFDGSEKSSRAGPTYGLRAVLRTRPSEYLPWIHTVGAAVFIHGSDETPFVDAFGYYVPVGTASSIGVRYVTREKLPSPYSTCSDTGGSQKNYYQAGYEVEACIRSCLQDKIIAQCACYDPAYAIPPNSNPISCGKVANSDVKVDCIFNLTDNDGLTGFDVNSQCSCPQNCIQSYYKVTLSTSRWPAAAYTPPECVKNKGVAPYVFWDTSGDCRKFYEEETVLVEVYYERMNYQILAESPAYPLINLVSDTGGSVGLWLGMSVISVIEFLTMLLLLICYFLARPTDAYHPKFDEKQKKDDDLILQEYLNERERQYQLGHGDLYQKDNHMVLPPAVQSSK